MNNKNIKSIALFIPHLGCPNKCVFCNQNAIASQTELPEIRDIESAVNKALMTRAASELEIAFFGGSFTCIGENFLRHYLDAAQRLVNKHGLHGIRFSTRPDGINEKIMELLAPYSIKTIELGAQSMIDSVLLLCGRGHTAKDTEEAAALIKSHGIDVVLQMMTGLPGSNEEKDLETVNTIVSLRPSAVRIYPTLVFQGTELEYMMKDGSYCPQTIDEAIDFCCKAVSVFDSAGIPVIKLGLNSESDFKNTLKAGPYHPAFRELVENRKYLNLIKEEARYIKGKIAVCYSPKSASKVVGHKGCNKKEIEKIFGKEKVVFFCDNTLKTDNIKIMSI